MAQISKHCRQVRRGTTEEATTTTTTTVTWAVELFLGVDVDGDANFGGGARDGVGGVV